MAKSTPSNPPTEDNEDDWVDENSDDDPEESSGPYSRMEVNKETLIKMAYETNALLQALMKHPKLNRQSPQSSPRPLFYTTDFVRRTFTDYLLPLLPTDAPIKSPSVANPYIFVYDAAQPMPDFRACSASNSSSSPNTFSLETETYLTDPNTRWPATTGQSREKYGDVMSRNMLIAMGILDSTGKGALMMGGPFDYGEEVEVAARRIMAR